MQIQTLVLGSLNTNTYLVSDELTQECVVIDAADDAQLISDEILRQNLTLKSIVATHGHYDHNLAAAELQINFDVPYLIHQADEFLIKELADRASYWLKRKVELDPPKISGYLKEGETVEFGKVKLEVVHTPGHTPGCCCLVNVFEGVIFTGDTLFADGIEGRTDLSYSSPLLMKDSLMKISQNWSGLRGLPGHGEEFIV
jgi:hydroxyacylglutathione hydrolase